MTSWNVIAGAAIIVLCAVILVVRYVKNGKKNMTMDEFIEMYGDNIISVLQDVITVLKINMADFATKEEYEKAIITASITALKENATEFGIPSEIIDLLDTESLTNILYKILSECKLDAFSVLGTDEIKKNEKLLDTEVVEVLGAATEE